MSTRVKICGLTRQQDVIDGGCQRLAPMPLGLVFYGPSPRSVSPEQAAELVETRSGLFRVGRWIVCESRRVRTLRRFWITGAAGTCSSFMAMNRRISVPVSGVAGSRRFGFVRRGRSNRPLSDYRNASGLLVDAWDPDRYGGTGQSFNWHLIPDHRPLPIILAGGLSSDNVFAAVEQVKPWAVDVSGGVEQGKGIKDIQKISHFIKEVHRVCKTD